MPNSQVVNAKKKVVEENEKCYSRKDINDKKANRLTAEVDKIIRVWIEDQEGHSIPLSQS